MKLCDNCQKIIGNYTELCRGCKPKKITKMTDYERRKKKMLDPEYAKAYREKDAFRKREYRKKCREAGIKSHTKYIPSLPRGMRPKDSVSDETIRKGYLKYLKSIGKLPEGYGNRKTIYY